jgi:hypothetical protein
MSLIERDCPRCVGTGSVESSDSTGDRYWGCTACLGTGRVMDTEAMLRQQLQGAVAERDAFARALTLAVASPALREAYVVQAKDALAREGRQ